jgi:hypothetical protein
LSSVLSNANDLYLHVLNADAPRKMLFAEIYEMPKIRRVIEQKRFAGGSRHVLTNPRRDRRRR